MSPSNRVTPSLQTFSASVLSGIMSSWRAIEAPPQGSVPQLSGGAFRMLTFYIRGKSSLRIHSFAAGNALFAARCATVAPHGEIQTLGEHGSLCGESGHTRATGSLFPGPDGCETEC